MREIRLYGSEGGGAVRSPYPYQEGASPKMSNQPKRGLPSAFRPRNQRSWIARSTRSMPHSPGIQVIFAWRHV